MRRWTLLLVLFALLGPACGGGGGNATSTGGCTGKVAGGPVTVKAWFHSGQGSERTTITSQVAAFNASQNDVKVQLVLLPEGNYNDQVKAAAASGGLPDILDFDGPFLYNYAWNRNLVALDSCISPALKANLLASIVKQGTYAAHFYGVGTFDSGLGLYTRKSVLAKNGIRIPSGPQDAWTADEFTQALKTLQGAGYKKAFGDDLVILPLPNFGKGSKTGMGSWQWGVTSNTKSVDASWAFINYLLKDQQVVAMTGANGAVPATKSASEAEPQYAPGGPEYIFVQQLQSTAVPRPQTPAYPNITLSFAKALNDIINGGDVKSSLDKAVQDNDRDIKDNDGYPVKT